MKVKHTTTREHVNNLSAKGRHPYMHKTIVYGYDVTPTCIKLLSVTRECQPELACSQSKQRFHQHRIIMYHIRERFAMHWIILSRSILYRILVVFNCLSRRYIFAASFPLFYTCCYNQQAPTRKMLWRFRQSTILLAQVR